MYSLFEWPFRVVLVVVFFVITLGRKPWRSRGRWNERSLNNSTKHLDSRSPQPRLTRSQVLGPRTCQVKGDRKAASRSWIPSVWTSVPYHPCQRGSMVGHLLQDTASPRTEFSLGMDEPCHANALPRANAEGEEEICISTLRECKICPRRDKATSVVSPLHRECQHR